MAYFFALAYLSGWAIGSLAVTAASQWLRDSDSRAPRTWAISLLAGAVWPLVILGLVQYGAIAAISKAVSARERDGKLPLLGGDEGGEGVVARVHQLDRPAQPSHLVLRGDRVGPPAVLGEPDGDVGTVGILVGQLADVERVVDAELDRKSVV